MIASTFTCKPISIVCVASLQSWPLATHKHLDHLSTTPLCRILLNIQQPSTPHPGSEEVTTHWGLQHLLWQSAAALCRTVVSRHSCHCYQALHETTDQLLCDNSSLELNMSKIRAVTTFSNKQSKLTSAVQSPSKTQMTCSARSVSAPKSFNQVSDLWRGQWTSVRIKIAKEPSQVYALSSSSSHQNTLRCPLGWTQRPVVALHPPWSGFSTTPFFAPWYSTRRTCLPMLDSHLSYCLYVPFVSLL